MSESEFQPERHDPSEAELRAMLEEREREKDLERAQTSRKLTKILIGGAVALAAAIFLFPSKPMPVAKAPADKPVIATPMPSPLNPDPTHKDPALMSDLKPFMIQQGQAGNQKEDIRFGVELLNFMNAADPKPAATPPNPTPPPHSAAAPHTAAVPAKKP